VPAPRFSLRRTLTSAAMADPPVIYGFPVFLAV